MNGLRIARHVGFGLALAAVAAAAAARQAQPTPAPGPSAPPAQARGPNCDAIVALKRDDWPLTLRRAWSKEVGGGQSTPLVVGDRVYIFSSSGEEEIVQALELGTGTEIWRQVYRAPYRVNPAVTAHGRGPKATPLVAGGRVITYGISGIASGFDAATGNLLWRRTFEETAMTNMPPFGNAASPILVDGLALFVAGDRDRGALVAVDPATGRERWRFSGEGPAYASPVVAEIGKVEQVLTFTRTRLVSVAASNGALLWSVPFTTEGDQNSVPPLVHDGIVIYSGLAKGVMAIRPVRQGLVFKLEKVWTNSEVSMHMSAPVLADGRIFGFSHRKRGQFFALDFKTGRTLWLSDGQQGDTASLSAGNGFWFALTDFGRLLVLKQDEPAFAPLRTYTVADAGTWAAPAIDDHGVLIKDLETLAYWRFD